MLCYRKYINTNDFRLYSGMELYKVIVPTLIFFLKESLAYFDDSKLSQCADYCRKNENLKITPESLFFFFLEIELVKTKP